MRLAFRLLASCLLVLSCPQIGAQVSETWRTLCYDAPAATWSSAFPIGNGRLGGMIFGGVERKRIQLNEDSLWSGHPYDSDNPQARDRLDEIRALLFAGKYKEAEALAQQYMVCQGPGSSTGNGAYAAFGSYQTLGDLDGYADSE